MASHSGHIDAELCSTQSDTTKTVIIPDIETEHGLKMIPFLEQPAKARKMSFWEALQFCPFYHQYEFPGGVDLCS